MAENVYRRFTRENLLSTTILAEPQIEVASGSGGWYGNTNIGDNTLSLYGGVRSRSDISSGSTSGLELYPLDFVDTKSRDGYIQIPGTYPATGSIEFVYCTNTDHPDLDSKTDKRWFDDHFSVVSRLSEWYAKNYKRTYHMAADFQDVVPVEDGGTEVQTFSAFHIPEMFYGRQIATGSVLIAINSFLGTYTWGYDWGAATIYLKDDGYGRLWWVPSTASNWNDSGSVRISGNVFYNEGLITLLHSSSFWHDRLHAGAVEAAEPHIYLTFRGQNPIKSMVFMCRMAPSEVNGSNNPTYYSTDSDGKRWAKVTGSNEAVTYITSIGLYNEHRQLVSVAKLAQPIRKRERDNIDIRLRLDI